MQFSVFMTKLTWHANTKVMWKNERHMANIVTIDPRFWSFFNFCPLSVNQNLQHFKNTKRQITDVFNIHGQQGEIIFCLKLLQMHINAWKWSLDALKHFGLPVGGPPSIV